MSPDTTHNIALRVVSSVPHYLPVPPLWDHPRCSNILRLRCCGGGWHHGIFHWQRQLSVCLSVGRSVCCCCALRFLTRPAATPPPPPSAVLCRLQHIWMRSSERTRGSQSVSGRARARSLDAADCTLRDGGGVPSGGSSCRPRSNSGWMRRVDFDFYALCSDPSQPPRNARVSLGHRPTKVQSSINESSSQRLSSNDWRKLTTTTTPSPRETDRVPLLASKHWTRCFVCTFLGTAAAAA